MAVKYIQERNDAFEFTNGHKKVLEDITIKFNLKSDAYALAFLLGVMDEQKGKELVVNGKIYEPNEEALKDRTDEQG